ncbi:hypothetical protein O7599_07175 [Streptomyces sp. WMMC500]|nr:hypothetical protein [Streptomyces sp. WMMC500]WBB62304.1 hypothetical protein O7599_07175 [Streptomyces sp. WMMC500]
MALTASVLDAHRRRPDLGNIPMANAFRRAWYVTFERVINMTWA